MNRRAPSLVVIGASAGGVEALKLVVADLPEQLPAAVAIVLHVSPQAESRLPEILSRVGRLPAAHARDGDAIVDSRIFVAPPDHHLLVMDGRFAVVRGPHENNSRPAVDPLFRSAADVFRRQVVAVILSGTLSDGVAGAAAVSAAGGTVFVQDPADADFPSMPASTIANDHPDRVVPMSRMASEIVGCVTRLSREVDVSENDRHRMSTETSYAALDRDSIEDGSPPGESSSLSCPACGGVLWEVDDGDLLRFRCRVGHAYTADSAFGSQKEGVDAALWAALRALLERKELGERLAGRARTRGWNRSAERFAGQAKEALEQAELIRSVLLERDDTDDT